MIKRFILPIILLFILVSESIFVDILPASYIYGEYLLVPRFLFVTIVFIAIYSDRIQGMLLGIIFGLLVDVVYTGILGIYMFSIPVISYIISKLARILQNHIVITSVLCIVGVVVLEFFVYGINVLIGFTNMNMDTFIYKRLISTLILNSVYLILFAHPLTKLLDKLSLDE